MLQFCFRPFCSVIVFSDLFLISFFFFFGNEYVLCKEGWREREIYGRPFTTVRSVPSNTDEEITILIADLTQLDEAWNQILCI